MLDNINKMQVEKVTLYTVYLPAPATYIVAIILLSMNRMMLQSNILPVEKVQELGQALILSGLVLTLFLSIIYRINKISEYTKVVSSLLLLPVSTALISSGVPTLLITRLSTTVQYLVVLIIQTILLVIITKVNTTIITNYYNSLQDSHA